MRRLCALAFIAALGAALLVPAARAAESIRWHDPTTGKAIPAQPGPLGLPTVEQFPAHTRVDFRPMVISTIFHTGIDGQNGGTMTNRDSTIVFDTRGYNRAALYCFFNHTADNDPGGSTLDTLGAVLIAVEKRVHLGAASDTNNTLPQVWHRTGNFDHGGSGVRDTIGSFNFVNHYGATANSRTVLRQGERPLVVTQWGQGPNRGIPVWVGDRSGNNSQTDMPPFVSFRLRPIRAYFADNTANDMQVIADSTFVSNVAQYTRFRCRCDWYQWNQ